MYCPICTHTVDAMIIFNSANRSCDAGPEVRPVRFIAGCRLTCCASTVPPNRITQYDGR